MLKSFHVVMEAAKGGVALSPTIVKEAHASVDREALEAKHEERYTYEVWDGKTDVNGIAAEVWLDSVPGCRQSIEEGHVAYHIYKDGKLIGFQPHHPHHAGRVVIRNDDPSHEHHVDKVAEAHITDMVQRDVDAEHMDLAMEKAIELHEERGVPMGLTVPEGGRK